MKNYRSFIMSCAVLASVGPASAANVIWNTVQAVTAATDVNTTGTLVYAKGFGASTTATVSGVTFNNTTSYSDTFEFSFTGFMNGITFIGSNNPEGQAYATLLDSGRFVQAGTLTAGITLSDLTVGQDYLVQFWVADFRSFPDDRFETVTGGSNTSGQLIYLDGDNSNSTIDASYVIGNFKADSTTQLFTLNANQDVLINAVQLRSIPEPTSVLLSALGAVALLRRRRA